MALRRAQQRKWAVRTQAFLGSDNVSRSVERCSGTQASVIRGSISTALSASAARASAWTAAAELLELVRTEKRGRAAAEMKWQTSPPPATSASRPASISKPCSKVSLGSQSARLGERQRYPHPSAPWSTSRQSPAVPPLRPSKDGKHCAKAPIRSSALTSFAAPEPSPEGVCVPCPALRPLTTPWDTAAFRARPLDLKHTVKIAP